MKTITAYGIVAGVTLAAFGWFATRINPIYENRRAEAIFECYEHGNSNIYEDQMRENTPRNRKVRGSTRRLAEIQREMREANIEGRNQSNINWFEYLVKKTKELWETPEFMEGDDFDGVYAEEGKSRYGEARKHFYSQARSKLELDKLERDYRYELEKDELREQYEKRAREIENARVERAKKKVQKSRKK